MNKIQYSTVTFNEGPTSNTPVEVELSSVKKSIIGKLKDSKIISNKEFHNALDALLTQAGATQVDFTKSKSMFRYPNLALSRDRVSILKDKYGTKVVRDKDKADLWVISDKYLSTLTRYQWGVDLIPLDLFFAEVEALKPKFKSSHFNNLMKDKETLSSDSYIELNSYYYGDDTARLIMQNLKDSIIHVQSGAYVTEDSLLEFKLLEDNLDKLVTDVVINNATSEDSVALDFKSYEQIAQMLTSNNDDRDVAMTLMANCKIEDSKTWLSILFYDHTWNMRRAKLWNQVAFKTLKKMFNTYIDRSSSGHNGIGDIKCLTSNLVKDGILNSKAEELMLDRIYKSVMKYMNTHTDTKVILDRKDIKLDVPEVAEESGLVMDITDALV